MKHDYPIKHGCITALHEYIQKAAMLQKVIDDETMKDWKYKSEFVTSLDLYVHGFLHDKEETIELNLKAFNKEVQAEAKKHNAMLDIIGDKIQC